MIAFQPETSSFRDPGGRVYLAGDRVYRTVNTAAAADFEFVECSSFLNELVHDGWVVPTARVDPGVLRSTGVDPRYVVEHAKLPFISYPYEWCFSALKAAAVRHLDIHLRALDHGVTLSDASAFNIQFIGAEPVFIDRLSFIRYREGSVWSGYGQFCEQFLNPLLLRACFGISHNAWYRGTQEGIPTEAIRRLLPWRRMLSRNLLVHVVLKGKLEASTQQVAAVLESEPLPRAGFPRAAFQRLLRRLRAWIAGLEPRDGGATVWRDYAASCTSYSDDEAAAKRRFVDRFVATTRPRLVWDLGCNTGDYAVAALEAGAGYAVGFDADQGALELGFARAAERKLPFTPLFLDAANPSSDQGWAQAERRGLEARASADAVLALALVHHLGIGRNIPLDQLLAWLIRLAPSGVVEFVPKADPMAQRLLRFRCDIFPDYDEPNFLNILGSCARVVGTERVSASGRLLVWYDRRA